MTNILSSYLPSSDIYTDPSFFKGVGRVMDLFGQMDEFNYRSTEEDADKTALSRDWTLIGKDLFSALTSYGRRTSK